LRLKYGYCPVESKVKKQPGKYCLVVFLYNFGATNYPGCDSLSSGSAKPVFLASIPMDRTGWVSDMFFVGKYVYLVTLDNREESLVKYGIIKASTVYSTYLRPPGAAVANVSIFDVSEPSLPIFVKKVELGPASGMTISGNYLYGIDNRKKYLSKPYCWYDSTMKSTNCSSEINVCRIHAYDVSDPVNPKDSGSYVDLPENYTCEGFFGKKINVVSNTLYLSMYGAADSSNKNYSFVLNKQAMVRYPDGTWADMVSFVKKVDISNPLSLKDSGYIKSKSVPDNIIGNYLLANNYTIDVKNTNLYIKNLNSEISNDSYNTSPSEYLQELGYKGSLLSEEALAPVKIFNNTAYLSNSLDVSTVDISNTSSPVEKKVLSLNGRRSFGGELNTQSRCLYLSTVLNTASMPPSHPELPYKNYAQTGWLDDSGRYRAGGYTIDPSIMVVDASKNTDIKLVNELKLGNKFGYPYPFKIKDNLLYVVDNQNTCYNPLGYYNGIYFPEYSNLTDVQRDVCLSKLNIYDVSASCETFEAPKPTAVSSSCGIVDLSWANIKGISEYKVWDWEQKMLLGTATTSLSTGTTTIKLRDLPSGNIGFYVTAKYPNGTLATSTEITKNVTGCVETSNTCENGAINYPECDICGEGKIMGTSSSPLVLVSSTAFSYPGSVIPKALPFQEGYYHFRLPKYDENYSPKALIHGATLSGNYLYFTGVVDESSDWNYVDWEYRLGFLKIVDISKPEKPLTVGDTFFPSRGRFPFGDTPYHTSSSSLISVVGNNAYIGVRDYTYTSDPKTHVTKYEYGKYGYGIDVYDVSNPTKPVIKKAPLLWWWEEFDRLNYPPNFYKQYSFIA
jgi:hypothetical protein